MISFQLTDEQIQMQETAHRFAEKEMRDDQIYREYEKKREIPARLLSAYQENGFHLINYPEELGGLDESLVTRVIVEEELAWGDSGITLKLDHSGFGALSIVELGSDEQRSIYLDKHLTDSKKIAFCLTEEDLGADSHGPVKTVADNGAISGKALNVHNGAEADYFVVFANTGKGEGWDNARAYVVAKDAAGITVTTNPAQMGTVTSPTATVTFEQTPADMLLESNEQEKVVRVLNFIRIITSSRLLGVINASVGYAKEYAMERPAFGKVIAEFQSIAFMIADAHTEMEALRWLVWKTASEWDKKEDATKSSCLALTHAIETASTFCSNSLQILGGAGFMQDHPIEKWLRDAQQLSLACGPKELLYSLAADKTLQS